MSKQKPKNLVFGPVPSRRLGRSLGIDTVPLKTCNWNCVYCQLGRTRPLINEPEKFFDPEIIFGQVTAALEKHKGRFDWVTFVGSGEGTLHSDFGYLVRKVKELSPQPVAVITNGSTLAIPEISNALSKADAVMPSLDAPDERLFKRVNRPRPELSFESHLEGLKAFASLPHRGRLAIEVMLLSGLNDKRKSLFTLREHMDRIGPDEIHLTLPTRCPAESWVKPSDADALMKAQAILGQRATLMAQSSLSLDLASTKTPGENLTEIVSRHPIRLIEASVAIAQREEWNEELADDLIQNLERQGRIRIVERLGESFLTAASRVQPHRASSS